MSPRSTSIATAIALAVAGPAVPAAATTTADRGPVNRPPVVTLTSPVAGTSVPIPGTLTLAANAYDVDGWITRVEFYVGNTRVGVDTTAPYTVSISTTTIGFGAFGAKARAYDNSFPPLASESGVVPFYVVTIPPEPPISRVSNPYSGAQQYVNPDWSDRVRAQAAETPGELGRQMTTVASYPTAVWLDGIDAITAGRGLVGHLDQALAQQTTAGRPVVVQLVLYNLPNRDCARQGASGELLVSADGAARYRAEFIDPIVAILGRPAYANLRMVTVVEPGALAALVIGNNPGNPILECVEAYYNGAYVQGIRYALSRLKTLRNVYSYLDVSSSARLGWAENAGTAMQLIAQTILDTGGPGADSVTGFATDTAEYVPVVEPFLPNPDLTVSGWPIYQSQFYDWNKIFDELDYAQMVRNALIQRGFPTSIGMVIDTGRNGWGGPNRPTQVSTSSDLDMYVDESRIDRRPLRHDWCNQVGAGLGERPVANPAPGIHAYAWLKPPGESDGVANPLATPDPDRDYLQHRNICNPEGSSAPGSYRPTNALAGAPHYGHWFPQHFAQLVTNAHPPVPPAD